MSKIKPPAMSLRELLVQIKDLAEIQLDLAYSAVLYDDKDAAHQVLRLESKITEYLGHAIIRAVMAGKDIDLAKKMLALIRFASALEDISDAAADIAKLTIENISLGSFKNILMHADEVTIRVKFDNKGLTKKTVDLIERESGMRVVAIRRTKKWILNPRGDFVLWIGDILYLTGPEERVDDAIKLLSSRPLEASKNLLVEPTVGEHLKNFFDVLVSLKYTAETSLSLSYYALLTGDKTLAKEVKHLEQWVDYMRDVLDVYTLRISRHYDEVDALRGFFRIIDATEEITDSAYKLAQIVMSDIDVSSLFRIIFDKADEKIIPIKLDNSNPLIGKTIGELNLEDNFGVFLIGIRRGRTWYFDPEDSLRLHQNDVIIIRGAMPAVNKFIEFVKTN